jgi:hypothetical protein
LSYTSTIKKQYLIKQVLSLFSYGVNFKWWVGRCE